MPWRNVRFGLLFLATISLLQSTVIVGAAEIAPTPLPTPPGTTQAAPAALSAKSLELLVFEDITMVTSSGFFNMEKAKAPGYSYIISQAQMENSDVRSLNEALEEFVPGLEISNHIWTGPLIGTRGITTDTDSKTMVMYDGSNLNSRMHFGFSNSSFRLPLIGDLKAVEVINGPGAIVHGSGALNGFINQIPKTGKDAPGFTVEQEFGFQDNSKRLEISDGFSYGENQNLFLYGGMVMATGYRPHDLSWYEQSISSMGFEPFNKTDYKSNDYPYPSFKLVGNWNQGGLNFKTLFLDTWGDSNTLVNWFEPGTMGWHHALLLLSPSYTLTLDDKNSIDFIANSQWIDQGFYAKTDRFNCSGSKESLQELKVIYKTTLIEQNSLAIGASAGKRDFHDRQWYFGPQPLGSFEGATWSWMEYAGFAEDIFKINPAWTASTGLRYDVVRFSDDDLKAYDTPGTGNPGDPVFVPDADGLYDWGKPFKDSTLNKLTGRLATSYEFNPDTNAKLSFQQGFRFPDIAQYKSNARTNKRINETGTGGTSGIVSREPLPALTPEAVDSYEFNVHHDLWPLRLSLDENVYYNFYRGLLVYVNNPNFDGTISTPEFSAAGLEVVADWRVTDNVKWEVSYGYACPIGIQDDALMDVAGLTNTDRDEWRTYNTHQIKTSVTGDLFDKKLILFGNLTWYSQTNVNYDPGLEQIYSEPRTVVNVMAKYTLTENLFAKLSIKNLFENAIPHPTVNPGIVEWGGYTGLDERLTYLELGLKF